MKIFRFRSDMTMKLDRNTKYDVLQCFYLNSNQKVGKMGRNNEINLSTKMVLAPL